VLFPGAQRSDGGLLDHCCRVSAESVYEPDAILCPGCIWSSELVGNDASCCCARDCLQFLKGVRRFQSPWITGGVGNTAADFPGFAPLTSFLILSCTSSVLGSALYNQSPVPRTHGIYPLHPYPGILHKAGPCRPGCGCAGRPDRSGREVPEFQ